MGTKSKIPIRSRALEELGRRDLGGRGAYGSISTLKDLKDLERETIGPSVPSCGFSELSSVARRQSDGRVDQECGSDQCRNGARGTLLP